MGWGAATTDDTRGFANNFDEILLEMVEAELEGPSVNDQNTFHLFLKKKKKKKKKLFDVSFLFVLFKKMLSDFF